MAIKQNRVQKIKGIELIFRIFLLFVATSVNINAKVKEHYGNRIIGKYNSGCTGFKKKYKTYFCQSVYGKTKTEKEIRILLLSAKEKSNDIIIIRFGCYI